MRLKIALLLGAFWLFSLSLSSTVAASPLGALIRGKLACFTETGNCVEGWNGTDINLYSDAGSTSKFSVDGATGNTTAAGTITVTGAQTQTGVLNANGGIAVDTNAFTVTDGTGTTAISGTLTVTSATALNGGLTMDTSAFSVADTSGATAISGTLTVSSTTVLSDDLDMTGQPIVNIGNSGTDFGTDGRLTTAQGITITSGGLTMESVLMSGPIVFSTTTGVVTGTTIAHGVGTTPTVVVTPQYIGEPFTQDVYVSAVNATNFIVAIESGGVTTITLHWMAGK